MDDLQGEHEWSQLFLSSVGALKSQAWWGWAITIAAALAVLGKLRLRRQWKLPPGPRAWPIVGSLPSLPHEIPLHMTFAKMAQQYGPIFFLQMGSNPTIVVSSPDMAKVVLKEKDRVFASRPPSTQGKYLGYDFKSLVFAESGEYHRRLRSFYQSVLFSQKSVASSALIRERELRRTMRSVLEEQERHRTVNLSELIYALSLTTLLSVTVGDEIGSEKMEQLKKMIRRAITLAGTPDLAYLIPALGVFGSRVSRQMKHEKEIHQKFFKAIIEEGRLRGVRKVGDGESLTLLQALLALDGDEKATDIDITVWLLDCIIPGTDTTAASVDWAMAELLRHPEITRRVVEELDAVVGKDRMVSNSDIADMPFLQCVVKEVLRLHHNTPLGLPRISVEDCEIAGYQIPAKTTLLVNYWVIGRDPNYWENPQQFNPDRFRNSDIDVKGQHFQVLPFSSGRRGCVGQTMALPILFLNVATLLQSFNWVAEGEVDMKGVGPLGWRREKDLLCTVTPRLPSQVYEQL